MPDDRAGFIDRRGSRNPHQHHRSRGYRNWRRRVHDDAQGAMVGIAVERVHMRHLDKSQERQQDKTHQCRRRQSARLWAAIAA